jgi:hypothetical protein
MKITHIAYMGLNKHYKVQKEICQIKLMSSKIWAT